MHRFVALDLELTPLPGNQQRIIEIAAVRFCDGEVVDQFSTLVNPRCDIAPQIRALTGITRGDVMNAPAFNDVAPLLRTFIGDDPVVGQSIHFDIDHLASHGMALTSESYDTYEMASILLPGLASYDLFTIARHLEVELDREHRALGDALVTGRVFIALLERAGELDLQVVTQINSLAGRIPDWPFRGLFEQLQRRKLRDSFLQTSPNHLSSHAGRAQHSTETVAPLGQASPAGKGCDTGTNTQSEATLQPGTTHGSTVDSAELRTTLEMGGAVASCLPAFEQRQEQLRMMEAVTRALNEGEHLLVEAGTGTGKSLAYLLPAVYSATKTGTPVVISTNTINLQDQLFHKDIPTLQQALPFPFKATLLKGRANYICLRRWLVLSRSADLTPADALLLIKILVWLTTTQTGDRSELSLSGLEASLWPKVSALAESCAFAKCPQYRRGACFVVRARRGAESADLVVVNHALLLSDLAGPGGILPDYSQVIIDEAHHLEEEATEQLGFTISRSDMLSFLAGLQQSAAGHRPTGALPDLLAALRLPPGSDTAAQIRRTIADASTASDAAMAEGVAFFDSLRCFLHDSATERFQQGARLRLTPSVRVQPGWSDIEVGWSAVSHRLRVLQRLLVQLHRQLALLEDGQLLDQDGILAEISALVAYIDGSCAQGTEAVSSPERNGIYWIESGSFREELCIRSAPLHVGEALNDVLFERKQSVVLTSATLTTEGSFEYVKERLGLEHAAELQVGSPFDYKQSTLLYVARDVPEPARPAYQRAIETAIADLAIALGGRTLVLFTSHSQLRVTSTSIRTRLESEGILVLAHAVDGSRRKLLQSFKDNDRAVLLGTSSFWEGIDVVGEALSALVIVKLPFSVPTDPVFSARSEGFDEPFRQFSVPQTILKFKQGFGRLIRSRSDRGVVAILDSRVGSKFYGPAFIGSLPDCTVRYGSADSLPEAAREWLASGSTGEEAAAPRPPYPAGAPLSIATAPPQ